MTIIVEDGSIVTNANSYVSEQELLDFASARGVTLVGDTEQLLIEAMDYIESLYYKGIKKAMIQTLQWPRVNVYVDGYYVLSTVIPFQLKNGQMQTAIAIDQGNSPLQNITRKTKREKVGDLEVEYSDNSVTNTINIKIISTLQKLLLSGASNVSVYRG